RRGLAGVDRGEGEVAGGGARRRGHRGVLQVDRRDVDVVLLLRAQPAAVVELQLEVMRSLGEERRRVLVLEAIYRGAALQVHRVDVVVDVYLRGDRRLSGR